MKASTLRRARHALDVEITRASVPTRPPSGWLRAIREASGITRPQLSRRLGVSQQTLAGLEQSEANGSIRLESLRKLADALDCDRGTCSCPVTRTAWKGPFRLGLDRWPSPNLPRCGTPWP